MPIYEYECAQSGTGCPKCRAGFEALQRIGDAPVRRCPECGAKVKRILSRCHAAVVESSAEQVRVEKEIASYEKAGMWSHAAELADTHSERTHDAKMKTRALDNYAKAGYDADSMAKSD